MKTVLVKVKDFFVWILYWFLTNKERHLYSMGKIKGMKCLGYRDDSLILYDSARIYEYDRNQEPSRDYMTWGEFWDSRKPNKV